MPTIERALATADVSLGEVDAIAVTAGPGLVGPLTVGASAAKALALALDKPLYGVNHVIGHAVRRRARSTARSPSGSWRSSSRGGHSSLLLLDDTVTRHRARLDARRRRGRGVRQGRPAARAAVPRRAAHRPRSRARATPTAIRFPRGLTAAKDQAAHAADFSFSGLKTAVARWVEARQDAGEEVPLHDVAASFAEAVADVLTAKTIAACRAHGVDTLVVGGGFSANSQLRDMAAKRCAEAGITLRIPPIRYCTDNGAMIAALGSAVVRRGLPPSSLDLPVDSSMPLTQVLV